MIELTLNKSTTVKLYSSIKEMPIVLHNRVQAYLLQDSGIGSDINSIDDHFKQMDNYSAAGQWQELAIERNNLRYNFFMMLEGIDFKSPSFACFIHSINNEPLLDYSEENLLKTINELSLKGLTMQMLEDQMMDLKKNFNPN